jgi:biotin synthase
MIDAERLDKPAVIQWLLARGELQEDLFRQARAVRQQQGADSVLLRGVVEISNYCEKPCSYCAMRCPNQALPRYRMRAEEILAVAAEIKRCRLSTVFLQAGQDRACDELLEEIIPQIKFGMGMNVLLCLGERPAEVYRRFAELGADSYILKFETSDPQAYRDIARVSPHHRWECMGAIRKARLRLGTGNIVGLPRQTLESIAEDFFFGLDVQPDFVSAAPFIPNEGTPWEGFPCGDLDVTLNLMALWRIALKRSFIPAVSALEKIRPDGQLRGLNAGANVITINFTPKDFRAKYAIYSEQRFVVSLRHALHTIHRAGLRVRHEAPVLAAAETYPPAPEM